MYHMPLIIRVFGDRNYPLEDSNLQGINKKNSAA
jgi:hypothetical protein